LTERGRSFAFADLMGRGRANDPLPVAHRAPRVAALERELDDLHRVEEALVAAALAAGSSVHRSPSAPPAAVLGVKIADKASRAA
jgi:hypothetical protein